MSKLAKILNILCVVVIVLGAGYYFLEPKLSKNKIINDAATNESQVVAESQAQNNIETTVKIAQNQNTDNTTATSSTVLSEERIIEGWRLYNYEKENFSIQFPVEPKIQEEDKGSYRTKVFISFFEDNKKGYKYTVEYIEMPKNISLVMSERGLLNYYADSLRQGFGDTITFSKDNKNFEVKTPKTIEKGVLFVNKNIIYSYRGGCFGCEGIPNLDEFLATFKLLK